MELIIDGKEIAMQVGMLELVCAKCTRFQEFRADTKEQAAKDARAKGWGMDGGDFLCPKHYFPLPAVTQFVAAINTPTEVSK